jgi:hypothetical protein
VNTVSSATDEGSASAERDPHPNPLRASFARLDPQGERERTAVAVKAQSNLISLQTRRMVEPFAKPINFVQDMMGMASAFALRATADTSLKPSYALGVPTRYFSDGAAESDGQYNWPSGSHYKSGSNAHVVVRAAISINARQHNQGYQAADGVPFEPRHHVTPSRTVH